MIADIINLTYDFETRHGEKPTHVLINRAQNVSLAMDLGRLSSSVLVDAEISLDVVVVEEHQDVNHSLVLPAVIRVERG